jgi:hypothetical protein
MTHQASPPPAPDMFQPHELGAARQYLDLSELPDCLSVRVSVSIRADDLSGPEETLSRDAPPLRRPLPR